MKPSKQKSINHARLLLRRSEIGVLSTHSKACDGYPFGSVSTFMSTHEGDVIFYISNLAQHTKNILHDNKMCLTVFPSSSTAGQHDDDPNANARLSLLGTVKTIDKKNDDVIAERFFKLYPDSRKYYKTHDFYFYKMSTDRVRFIGGFGDIHWINKEDWLYESPQWAQSETNMVQHMNEDHVDAMSAICAYYAGVNAEKVELLAINPEGAFYKCDDQKPIFIGFDEAVFDSMGIRKALVAQTNTAREKLDIKKETH